jgi:hypothetical protein
MPRNYSFISISESPSRFKMHAIVQLVMKTWMETNGQLERWWQNFIRILCAGFPNGSVIKLVQCQELFPHAKLAAAQHPRA